MRKATKTVATWLGIVAGIAGLEHGYFEILQGNTRPAGLMFASMGPPCAPDKIWNACAGHADNQPGQVNFTPVAPVWDGNDFVLLLTHLGMILFCGFLEWRAVLTGRPAPGWMFQAR